MTVQVLERGPDQRMAALAIANDVRFARARLKRALRAGRADVVALVADPPSYLHSMKVEKLLAALPGVGRVKVRRIMIVARISEAKTVGGLSVRQRDELVALLEARRIA